MVRSRRSRPARPASRIRCPTRANRRANQKPARTGRADRPAPGGTRVRVDLRYDGTGFCGWASQPGRRSVQGTVEWAFGLLLGAPAPRLTVAGRTDAGVHAAGQVAHADLPAAPPADLAGRLNRLLPPDVRVAGVRAAPAGFDARFSAASRVYRYRVTDRLPDPLRRFDTLAHPRSLDEALMAQAAGGLIGERDFAAFCRRRPGAGTVRRLLRLSWRRDGDGVLAATVEADAFCQGMVRSLIGALLAVGEGRRPADWPAELLGRAARDPAVRVAPAHGLTLLRVRYPPERRLAAQAVLTRRRRG